MRDRIGFGGIEERMSRLSLASLFSFSSPSGTHPSVLSHLRLLYPILWGVTNSPQSLLSSRNNKLSPFLQICHEFPRVVTDRVSI